MIDKYKTVSIIYGTRGKKCACTIADLISQYHSENIYPVKAELLAEQYLNCENVIKTIKDIIEFSDICIILLTFDDINNTRVRQNVLIELGMTMVLLKASQCYFFSEKIPLPEDFPSDFRHSINPNYFNPEQPEKSAEEIKNYIVGKLDLTSYRNIITDNNYIYDYEEIIQKLPPSIYDLKAEKQMQQILCEWSKTLESFEFAAEPIIYFLERCVFLPLFTNDETLSDFFKSVHNKIKTSSKDYGRFDHKQVNTLYKLAHNVLQYLERSADQVSEQKNNPNNFDGRKWHKIFSSIADSLEQTANDIRSGKIKVNWYLYLIACDYAGLARMRAVRFGNLPQIEYENSLRTAKDMFNKASVLVQEYCIHSAFLWEGFIQYNISRIYELLYDRDRKEVYLQGIRDASKRAIDARKRTIYESCYLKGIFSVALTYEYFTALYHEYELEYKWPEFYEGDLDDIARNINEALKDLDIYCNATGLRKLYDVRDNLRELLIKTGMEQNQ